MVKVFVRQIKRGTITIDDVPEKWLEQVRTALAESEV